MLKHTEKKLVHSYKLLAICILYNSFAVTINEFGLDGGWMDGEEGKESLRHLCCIVYGSKSNLSLF